MPSADNTFRPLGANQSGTASSQDEAIRKIKSVLRLANRAGSEGEAQAARLAAERLAKKAGIALEDLQVTDNEIRTGMLTDEKWHIRTGVEMGYISSVIREHFGVVVIQNVCNNKVRFSWIGTKLNIAVAKWIFEILYRECTKAWADARIDRSYANRVNTRLIRGAENLKAIASFQKLEKQAFLEGWFSVIHQKLTEHPLRNDLEQFQAEKKSANDAFDNLKKQSEGTDAEIKQRGGNNKQRKVDIKSVMLGVKAAEGVNLNRPVQGKETKVNKLMG